MLLKKLDKNAYQIIEADHTCLDYMGRIDFSHPKAPTFIFAGSQIHTRFEGTSVRVILKNYNHYYRTHIGFLIDGNGPYKVPIQEQNEDSVLTLIQGLEEGTHDLIIYKTHDGAHYFDFKGLVLDRGCKLKRPEQKPKRRIECFGDSISAGSVVEAIDYVGKKDPDHEGEYCNSWYSYIMMTARNLKAQIHNTSQGGMALFDKTGYFCEPNAIGMETAYNKIRYNPELGEMSPWDFKEYIPHIIVIAIGQNDAHPENYINTDKKKKSKWKEGYKEFIRKLKVYYPQSVFILTLTLLEHDRGWDDAITEIQKELDDPKVLRFLYKRNGIATPGHVRISESKEMAEELTAFINSIGEKVWED